MKCAERTGRLSHSRLSQIPLYFANQTPKSSFLWDDTDLPVWQRKGGNKESENGMGALPRDLVHFVFAFLSSKMSAV